MSSSLICSTTHFEVRHMNLIEKIKTAAKANKKTIILPEPMDRRVLEAADKILKEDIANIILIGKPEEMDTHGLDLTKAKIIQPGGFDRMEQACTMVRDGFADGIVSGACHSTAETLRPALHIIRGAEGVSRVSAFFLMEVPDCEYGENGAFIFGDSGLVQNPTAEQLAEIAGLSAKSFKNLVGTEPKVALLSHSTKGSAKHTDVDKVIAATKLAQEKYLEYEIDGELQLDAAIVPEIAEMKAPKSKVAGSANVLIFPDLDAGNIGYKLVQRLAKAKAYGPITQGMAKPVNDLSRGCSVDDIVGVVAITALQAQQTA